MKTHLFYPFVLACLFFGCIKNRKDNPSPISPNAANEILKPWKLIDYRQYVEYGVIGLTTYADLRFKNAIDSAEACERSMTYQFLFSQDFLKYQDLTTCATDTVKGTWVLDLQNPTLSLFNGFIVPPYSGRALLLISLFQTNTQTSRIDYQLSEINSRKISMSTVQEGSLTKERWDEDPEAFTAIFGNIRSVLPINIKVTTYYTLAPK